WTQDDYERALVSAIVDDDDASLQQIDAAYRSSPFAKDNAVAVAMWEADVEQTRLLFNKKADVQKLKLLSEEDPTNVKLLRHKARALDELREYESAAKTYEEGAGLETSPDEKAPFLINAALSYAHSGDKERAIELFETVKEMPISEMIRRSWLLPSLQTF